jgi:hypothetical protein
VSSASRRLLYGNRFVSNSADTATVYREHIGCHVHRLGRSQQVVGVGYGIRIGRINQRHDQAGAWQELTQQPQAFRPGSLDKVVTPVTFPPGGRKRPRHARARRRLGIPG